MLDIEFTEPPGITGVHVNWLCVRAYLRDSAGSISYLGTSSVTAGTQTCGSSTCLRRISYDMGTASRAPGAYQVLLAADDQNITFMRADVSISSPLYLVMSTDWDYPQRYADSILPWMDGLRATYPGLAFSHFVGAYMWPGQGQAALLPQFEQWLLCKSGRLPAGGSCSVPSSLDEIGVHVHGHNHALLDQVPVPGCCSNQTCAAQLDCSGAPPRGTDCATTHVNYQNCYLDETWDPANESKPEPMDPGYSTLIRSFSGPELQSILDYSSRVLVGRNFAQPTSFRAGGWSGGGNVLAALAASTKYAWSASGPQVVSGQGYLIDSSSVPPSTVCDKVGESNRFCISLRSSAGLSASTVSTSQPYWSGTVLEVPDNGSLADYRLTAAAQLADLCSIFRHTACSGAPAAAPLTSPKVYQYGFHPHNANTGQTQTRVTGALTELAKVVHGVGVADLGPGIWTTISRLAQSSIASP